MIISLYCIKCLDVGGVRIFFETIFNLAISVSPSVSLSTQNNSAPTGRIFTKFDIKIFWKSVGENSSFVTI